MKSVKESMAEVMRKFDRMIDAATDENSLDSEPSQQSEVLKSVSCSSEPSEFFVGSEASDYSVPSISSGSLEFCNSVTSVSSMYKGGVSVSSVPSVPSMYTWEELALAEKAAGAAKQRLPAKIRSWYEKWIDPVFEADAETWQIQISDMIGKHLMHATGEENTLALVTAFYDLNAPTFASIPREGFIASAEEVIVRELASWSEALPSGEAAYYSQLPKPQQEAFRICRSLALRALEKNGTPIFFLGSHELAKRITISDREAARILNKSPFLSCVEKGKPWQPGIKPKASSWQWIYPLEAAAKSRAEKSACPF
jgi:hypothetical protein